MVIITTKFIILLLISVLITGCESSGESGNEVKEDDVATISPNFELLQGSLSSEVEVEDIDVFELEIATFFEGEGYIADIMESDTSKNHVFSKDEDDQNIQFQVAVEYTEDNKAKVYSTFMITSYDNTNSDSFSLWAVGNDSQDSDKVGISVSYMYEPSKFVNINGSYSIESEEYELTYYYDEERNVEEGSNIDEIIEDYDIETDEFEQMPQIEALVSKYISEYNNIFKSN